MPLEFFNSILLVFLSIVFSLSAKAIRRAEITIASSGTRVTLTTCATCCMRAYARATRCSSSRSYRSGFCSSFSFDASDRARSFLMKQYIYRTVGRARVARMHARVFLPRFFRNLFHLCSRPTVLSWFIRICSPLSSDSHAKLSDEKPPRPFPL